MNGVGMIFFILFLFTPFFISAYQLGIEAIPESFYQNIKNDPNMRIGMFTNQTGVNHKGERSIDILCKKGVTISVIFVPEHGLAGTIIAGQMVEDTYDEKTKIPVKSLYKKGMGVVLDQENTDPVTTIIVDIQEVGMRHYTYIITLLQLMKVAQKSNKKVVILDRPNILSGVVEGPLVDPEFSSKFISLAPIPLRHGLTIGELARYFNAYALESPVDLEVIPLQQYVRTQKANALLAPLSPYLPTLKSCYGYSFLGLLGEVRPFDVGLGTKHPFRVIGLPESDSFTEKQWIEVSCLLAQCGINSIAYSYYSERKKKQYKGLLLKPKMAYIMYSFKALYYLIACAKKNGLSLTFSDQFNRAIGTQLFRNAIEGSISCKELEQSVKKELTSFVQKVSPFLLYGPLLVHYDLCAHKETTNVVNK